MIDGDGVRIIWYEKLNIFYQLNVGRSLVIIFPIT